MPTFLAAWPPVAERRLRATGYDLAGRAASLHASPRGDFPQPPARRLPRHGALDRALQPIRRSQSAVNTEPLFRLRCTEPR